MKKLFFLPILGILLFSCSKKEIIQVNGIIHGYVVSNSTGEYLSGVTVTYRQGADSGSVTTDAGGYYYISGLDAGYVPLTFALSGYISYMGSGWIQPLDDYYVVKGGDEVPYYEEYDVSLPVSGSTITGVLTKEVGPTSDVRPAANYRVMVYTSYNYSPSIYETTTNTRGEFTITDLPSDMQVYVYFQPSSDDDNYYARTSQYVYTPLQGTVEIRDRLDRTDLGIYLVSTNLWDVNGTFVQTFPVNESIVLNFNQTVSKELTERDGYIILSGVTLDPDDDIEYSGSSVTITPPSDLANDVGYTLSFSVSSATAGDLYSNSIGFRTEE